MSDTVTDVKAYQWCAEGQWRDVAGGKFVRRFRAASGQSVWARGRVWCRGLEQAANWVYPPAGEVLASNFADTQSIEVDVLVEIANRASAGNPL